MPTGWLVSYNGGSPDIQRSMSAPGDSQFVDRVFLTKRRQPRLVRCAVLFVDLLGVRLQRDDLVFYTKASESPQAALLVCDGDGWTFVNYLGLLFDEPDEPRPALEMHRDGVVERLRQHRASRRLWEEYRWSAECHNDVVRARLPGEPSLLVPAADITWDFAAFA